ncbi:SRPBCC family protein [Sedimentitalea sp.]|uniref:SRPBCC family protein n=1 Tax=Sedimentitalea sp. TaxID=2048915 RepID=UPI0032975DB3
MSDARKIHYEIEHVYPNADRQTLWDLFVDHEAWSKSERLPSEFVIVTPGEGHAQGLGAVRKVVSGSMNILEDIVGFQPPEYFSYASRNGDMPLNDFVGEVFFEGHKDGVRIRYRGAFNPKYFGTGWLFRIMFRRAQSSALQGLGLDYADRNGA